MCCYYSLSDVGFYFGRNVAVNSTRILYRTMTVPRQSLIPKFPGMVIQVPGITQKDTGKTLLICDH